MSSVWGHVHKRDGSVYTGDCYRACKASLAYSSAASASAPPVFKRLTEKERVRLDLSDNDGPVYKIGTTTRVLGLYMGI